MRVGMRDKVLDLWDVQDRAAVVLPVCGDDFDSYQAGVNSMPIFLRERYYRALNTISLFERIYENGDRMFGRQPSTIISQQHK